MASWKSYEYKTLVLEDRGHLSDPLLLSALNAEGAAGWRHKEDQPKGASQLAILLERETTHDDGSAPPSDH